MIKAKRNGVKEFSEQDDIQVLDIDIYFKIPFDETDILNIDLYLLLHIG
jgi:hypothetical protein